MCIYIGKNVCIVGITAFSLRWKSQDNNLSDIEMSTSCFLYTGITIRKLAFLLLIPDRKTKKKNQWHRLSLKAVRHSFWSPWSFQVSVETLRSCEPRARKQACRSRCVIKSATQWESNEDRGSSLWQIAPQIKPNTTQGGPSCLSQSISHRTSD